MKTSNPTIFKPDEPILMH